MYITQKMNHALLLFRDDSQLNIEYTCNLWLFDENLTQNLTTNLNLSWQNPLLTEWNLNCTKDRCVHHPYPVGECYVNGKTKSKISKKASNLNHWANSTDQTSHKAFLGKWDIYPLQIEIIKLLMFLTAIFIIPFYLNKRYWQRLSFAQACFIFRNCCSIDLVSSCMGLLVFFSDV